MRCRTLTVAILLNLAAVSAGACSSDPPSIFTGVSTSTPAAIESRTWGTIELQFVEDVSHDEALDQIVGDAEMLGGKGLSVTAVGSDFVRIELEIPISDSERERVTDLLLAIDGISTVFFRLSATRY